MPHRMSTAAAASHAHGKTQTQAAATPEHALHGMLTAICRGTPLHRASPKTSSRAGQPCPGAGTAPDSSLLPRAMP